MRSKQLAQQLRHFKEVREAKDRLEFGIRLMLRSVSPEERKMILVAAAIEKLQLQHLMMPYQADGTHTTCVPPMSQCRLPHWPLQGKSRRYRQGKTTAVRPSWR